MEALSRVASSSFVCCDDRRDFAADSSYRLNKAIQQADFAIIAGGERQQ
jgi:hypothetical protein